MYAVVWIQTLCVLIVPLSRLLVDIIVEEVLVGGSSHVVAQQTRGADTILF